jgi:hypothetical protein
MAFSTRNTLIDQRYSKNTNRSVVYAWYSLTSSVGSSLLENPTATELRLE